MRLLSPANYPMNFGEYLDEVFVISGIIKVQESVISLIIHWFMENIQKLLREIL